MKTTSLFIVQVSLFVNVCKTVVWNFILSFPPVSSNELVDAE